MTHRVGRNWGRYDEQPHLFDAPCSMQYGLPILTSDHDFQKIPQIIVRQISPV